MKSNNFIVVGLGNPGNEYAHTRHNAGRDIVEAFAKKSGFPEFEFDKYANAYTSEGKIKKASLKLLLPETFVNNSGDIFKKLKPAKKDIENIIVVQDDLDLPVGRMKIVKNRGSGGHKGVESVMKALKTANFIRLRVGIAKASDLKKSQAKREVVNIVIGTFSPKEKLAFRAVTKKAVSALESIVTESLERTMNTFN